MLRSRVLSLSILVVLVAVVPVPGGPPEPRRSRGERQDLLAEARLLPSAQSRAPANPRIGDAFSQPCILDSYLAIERTVAEFGVSKYTDNLVRIAACESRLLPSTVGTDPADIGLFQWNEKPPRTWWTTARTLFNAWQDRRGSRQPRHLYTASRRR